MTATLEQKLQALVDEHADAFADYAWVSEKERWGELLYCLLASIETVPRERARRVVLLLAEVGMLEPGRLAKALESPTGEEGVVVAAILKAQGVAGKDAATALRVLGAAGHLVHAEHEDRIQRFLRRHAEQMVDELARPMEASGAPPEVVRHALRWWLQNACGMPVSLAQPAVLRYCEKHGARVADLLQAADRIDVNVAVVDDLLEVLEQDRAAPAPAAPAAP